MTSAKLTLTTLLGLGLLAGCGGSGSRSNSSAAPATSGSSAATTTSGTPTAPPPPPPTNPPPTTSPLPTAATLTDLGAPSGGLPVTSDLVGFDGRLWLMQSLDPLARFGAQVWTWDPLTQAFTQVLDDPTSQGYLRGRLIDGKLYVPDGDPSGLAPGAVYIFDDAATPPRRTRVDGAVHNFDVVKLNGELYTSGGLDTGASGLNRYDPATDRWVAVSQGTFSRLKYLAVFDGALWASKRGIGSPADLVRIDAGLTQTGVDLLQGTEANAPVLTVIDGFLYLSLGGAGGVAHLRLEPGGTVTPLTGLGGTLMFDFVKHSDGNLYALGTDGTNSVVVGSSDGLAFTTLATLPDDRFGFLPSGNADGRPSIASFQGELYLASSTNGRLYRLD